MEIKTDEIVKSIKQIPVKACTWDRIPLQTIKELLLDVDRHEETWQYIMEELIKGRNSIDFKSRLMLLIKDDSKPPSTKNTRPIAISSNLVKLLEKVIQNRIQDVLEK